MFALHTQLYTKHLENLKAILEKAISWQAEAKLQDDAILQARLALDMFPFVFKARWMYSKSLRLNYIALLEPPSGFEKQDVSLGFDPGSHFDGVSVSSERCNHLNLELIHNKDIKKRMDRRRGWRRLKRSRLRQRPARFESRYSEKMCPTIRSMFNFRKFTIGEILKLFPISKAIFERVAYQGKNQFSFTQVHLGQQAFIDFLHSNINIVKQVKGYITKAKRIKLFGEDFKSSDKGERSFFAHCLDSFSLSVMGLTCRIKRTAICRFISKNILVRRELFREKALQGHRKEYVKYSKGGIPNYYTRLGKPTICYVQKYSNSFREFDIVINNRSIKVHKWHSPFGGTIAKGGSKFNVPKGISKRCIFKNSNLVRYSNRFVKLLGGTIALPKFKPQASAIVN
jgi:hypothetical protein